MTRSLENDTREVAGSTIMNLYLISQSFNEDYETYDSAVVAATSEDEARRVHPCGMLWDGGSSGSWANADHVSVELIGVADQTINPGVICASYNAG